MRPRSLRIRPADDDEFLPVQRFGFAPEAAVSRRIGRVDRLGDDALEAKLAGVLQDDLAVAFDLLHLDGQDVSTLTLLERKSFLEPLVANKPGLQFNGHDTGGIVLQ